MQSDKKATFKTLLVVSVLLVLFLSARARWSATSAGGLVKMDSGYRETMGTFARIVSVAKDRQTARKAIEAGFEQIKLVDDLMSDYKQDSQISRVNRNAFRRPVKVSEPVFEVLQEAVRFSKLTAGVFDVTVGPLVDLWRRAAEANSPPSQAELQQARSKVGYKKLVLDATKLTVRFTVEGMRLDLGGIAKGYAIDRAVKAMKEASAAGGMVDLGGDIMCFGAAPPGKKSWHIGLQDPHHIGVLPGTGSTLLVLKLTDRAIATSGNYRRFFLIDGKKFNHIIDVNSGKGGNKLSSVTIISRKATDADALATAVSVMGLEKGLALVEKLPDTEAIVVGPAPKFELTKTSGAQKYIDQTN